MWIDVIRTVAAEYYTNLFASLLTAFLAMYPIMYIKEHGKRAAADNVVSCIKDKRKIRILIFAIYAAMLLFRTVLCRKPVQSPFTEIFGGWGLHNEKGELDTSGVENIILFVPLTGLMLYSGILKYKSVVNMIFKALIVSALLSMGIELFQTIFFLGSFQLSDLVFNTLGGVIGGCIYCIIKIMKKDDGFGRK